MMRTLADNPRYAAGWMLPGGARDAPIRKVGRTDNVPDAGGSWALGDV